MTENNYIRIYAIVKKVPYGKVATYGQIAFLAGLPGHARQVGYALYHLKPGKDIPWHRIINAKGEISKPDDKEFGSEQRQRLLSEGILFSDSGKISLSRFQWNGR